MKLHCKAMLLLLVCGSANAEGLTDAYDDYLVNRKGCFESASSGIDYFPNLEWIRSLDEEQRRSVLIYLAQSAYNRCIEPHENVLREVVQDQSEDIQNFFEKYVGFSSLTIALPADVDPNKLKQLDSEIKKPFSVNDVYQLLKNEARN